MNIPAPLLNGNKELYNKNREKDLIVNHNKINLKNL